MIGQTISHYRILEKLGEGGMGVVYKAHDITLDRDVALKFLPANLDAAPDEVARFEQEARAISALNHPNIAIIHDVGEWNGQRFLVLEYIAGGTLKSKLKRLKSEDKQFTVAEIFDYGIQMAEGLSHAHRHGIVHRDVKSENVMLTEEGTVKLTDFGLAKLRGNVQITKAGSTLGTAAYMSPEQIRGEDIDHRSDIFSLGIVLYELATAHLPFLGEFEAALSYSILNEQPASVASVRPDAPKELERIISRCLEKDRAKRYQNADEIVTDLKKAQLELTGGTKAIVKRFRLPYAIAAALVLALIVAVWLFLPSSHPTGSNSKTIAVLPFANMNGNFEEEFFSDGITDDILTQLAKIADLNVISRTSVMQYKGTKKTIREIGKELNAGVVLEGSVRRAGDQIRIIAQLIDAENDRHLWAETYDREYKQVLAIQSEIARNISTALHAQLSPKEIAKLKAPLEANTAAYSLFLQGRYFVNRRDAANTAKGIAFYQRALAIDSTDARLWAALSEAYVQVANTISEDNTDLLAKAREAALRAIALDDNSAEGHRVLALILTTNDWNWQEADREFKRALAIEPGNAHIITQMSLLSAALGKFDESIALSQKAIALDPILDANYFALAFTYR